jgi:hypothetical protein
MTDKEKRKKELQEYLSQNTMQINGAECWKCGKSMKMALVLSKGDLFGPEGFDEKQLDLARSKGVLIKMQYSKTTKLSYLANTCPACSAFIGEFFIHDYLDSPGERYKLD